MKKLLLAVILTFLVVAVSFGADFKLSAGGGVQFQGTYDMGWKWYPESIMADLDNNQFGLFLFFDATYAELDLSFNYGAYTWGGEFDDKKYSGNEFTMEISLMGKYPFYLEKFTLFPLLGIGGKIAYLGGESEFYGSHTIKVMDTGGLIFLAGVGADFPLTERLYLRGEVLYCIKLQYYAQDQHETRPGHGPTIKLGIGYSF
jgi:hypothetical protein